MQLLVAEPLGLSAPELRRRLRPPLSQPTLWRIIDRLRASGQVTVEGRARATRYHACERVSVVALRSRHLHRIIAARIARNPFFRERARERLQKIREVNPHGRVYHDRWERLLDGPLPSLLRLLTEDSELADAMRKESPFTFLVEPTERHRVFRSIRAS